ncbi:MAG: hypothetical protein WAO98_07690 [Alphaproteobacteria bacterium]
MRKHNNQKNTESTLVIRDMAGIDHLRGQIETIHPLLKTNLPDIRRQWWHFCLWKPAMDSICRHNNRVFKRHLPDNILLSVDVAFRLALHMTGVGNATDRLVDAVNTLHKQLFALNQQLADYEAEVAELRRQRAAVIAALEQKIADDVISLSIKVTSLHFFPNPITLASAIWQAGEMASGVHYEPYREAERKLSAAIRKYEDAIAEIHRRKKQAIQYIGEVNEALNDMPKKKDPVLQNYGLIIDERGLFVLKRGSWYRLPWDMTFETSKGDRTATINKTPKMYELAVLDVGIRPNVTQSPHFARYSHLPPLNVSFLHRKTTQYLCGLKNTRLFAEDVRVSEMDHFARGGLGRSGHTDTGRFIPTFFGATRWRPHALHA